MTTSMRSAGIFSQHGELRKSRMSSIARDKYQEDCPPARYHHVMTLLPSADDYASEPVRYPQLDVLDVRAIAAEVDEPYSNTVLNGVNESCVRLAVFTESYRWHAHPTSDEFFLVVEGCLAIDLADGGELRLTPWQAVTIPAGTVHRARAIGRTINLCFERLGAETHFVDSSP
jgi:mannose-6-phosphate isomerase-like protein (cupin superfamily)